jgi:hypothetical protein
VAAADTVEAVAAADTVEAAVDSIGNKYAVNTPSFYFYSDIITFCE